MFQWTPERIAELIKLWQQGLTKIEIAQLFNVTDNVIAGKAWRIGLRKDRKAPVKSETTKKKEAEARRIRAAKKALADAKKKAREAARAAKAKAKAPVELAVVEPVQPPAEALPETIQKTATGKVIPLDRVKVWTERNGSRECAFPIGRPFRPAVQECCGRKTVGGKSYCLEHYDLMYQPAIYKRQGQRRA